MGLRRPFDGLLTQPFGPSVIDAEPAMFATADRAYWQPFPGARYYPHFHAALDLAAAAGTPILASETGIVIESYYARTNGGGNKVRVEIRPGTSYCHNHMARRMVFVGDRVMKGQQLGTVGSTGWSTGPHDHFWLGFDDAVGSQIWPRLYDPVPYFMGGP